METHESEKTVIPNQETSIFTEDDLSIGIYDKHIRQARNAIFATAGIILLSLIIYSIKVSNEYEYLWIDILFYSVFIGGFIALGFWTKKKPYSAISYALILYGIFIAINAYFDVKTLFSGIIIKIIIISLLVKGLSDAKAAQDMQQLKK